MSSSLNSELLSLPIPPCLFTFWVGLPWPGLPPCEELGWPCDAVPEVTAGPVAKKLDIIDQSMVKGVMIKKIKDISPPSCDDIADVLGKTRTVADGAI